MAFVATEGKLKSLSRLELPPASRLQLSDSLSMAYYELWRKQSAVRMTVNFLARNTAQLGIHVFERRGDDDRRRITQHPLAELLRKPHPQTTRYRLIDDLVHDLAIYDRAYWQKILTKDGVSALARIPPDFVTEKGESWLHPEYFEVKGSAGKIEVPADQIVYFHGYSNTGIAGDSPLEGLRQTLSEEFEASNMRSQVLRNGARVSGYLERPAGAPMWTREAKNQFREGWRSQYTGNGPQSGGTPVLEEGMTFKNASQTAEQLQYIEARKLTREEVAAAYFIPPSMLGIMGSATFSNIQEQHKMLYQDTLGPLLQQIKEEIELQLVPDLADEELYVEFNIDGKLAGSFEERASAIQTSVGGPYISRNEARARENLPPVPGGDELITPLNVIIGGQASPSDITPTEPGVSNGTEPPADEETEEETQ
ncbi:phage portal protein [Rhodococcus erythropolis]